MTNAAEISPASPHGVDAAAAGSLTFLFTDIEGSTRLLEALGDAYATVLLEHRRLIRAVLAQCHGREQSTEGDSFFALFDTAADGILAAGQIQRALAAHDWGSHPVRVRIGVHAGRAARVGDAYVGIDIHRAARIMAAAHGGQVLLSDEARLSAGELPDGLATRDLGRHRLKDVGVERLWQLEGPGLPSGPFGPLRSLEAHPSNLPAELTPMFGRETDVERVASLVSGNPVTTVTGPGGIGKSRLAIHVGHRLLETFPDGVFYLDVGAADGVDVALEQLQVVLGIRTSGDDIRGSIVEHLRGRDLLIVLDTVDRLPALGSMLAEVAARCPRVHFLVTARSPLHLAIEREFPLSTLPPTAAVALFVDRARAVRPGFAIDGSTEAVIADIAARLDGLPLAIELAAARTRLFSPAALRDRLSRRLPLLTGGSVDRPDRQRTLHDTIAWSYDLLAAPERRTFERLGVFADTFDLAGVEAVATDPDGPADDPIAALERLVDRSLVSPASEEEGRFHLLGTIREFAIDALRAAGHETDARDAHARHFRDLAAEQLQSLGGPDDLEAIARIEREEAELRAALEWLLGAAGGGSPDQDRAALGLELAGTLGRFWWLRGRVREGSEWLERALAAAAGGPPADRATALFWSGVLYDDLRMPERAAERLDACLAIRRDLGDPGPLARTLNSLGAVARSLGDLDRAEALIAESLNLSRDAGERGAIASATSNLAIVAYERGDVERAIALFDETRAIDEAAGARGAIASSTLNLGTVLIEAGRLEEGLQRIASVVPDIAEIGDPELLIGALEAVAAAALEEPAVPGPGGHRLGPDDAARLVYAAGALRERERVSARPSEQVAIERVERRIETAVGESVRATARGESAVVDVPAGVAILSAALGLPVGAEPIHPIGSPAGA